MKPSAMYAKLRPYLNVVVISMRDRPPRRVLHRTKPRVWRAMTVAVVWSPTDVSGTECDNPKRKIRKVGRILARPTFQQFCEAYELVPDPVEEQG
jgi:hypothetical protein